MTTRSSRRLAWAAAIALFLAIYLGSAFTPALQDDVDTSHAEAAREMLTRGDFVTLHINGVRYLEKAPLMYWAIAGCFRVLGVNDFAARLPTVLAMLGLMLLGMEWGRRAFGARAGLYTGLFTATAAGCFLFTRVLIPEAILSLLIAGAFYCLVCALDRPATGAARATGVWWYAVYALLALAVLTKGLLALVVVGMTLLAYLAVSGEWRRWREFRLGSGLLLFFAVAAPWHVLAGLRNPAVGDHHGFFWFYFVNEHFLRFLGKRIPKDYNKLPGYLYWTLHLVWLFPWSLYLPLMVRRMWVEIRGGSNGKVNYPTSADNGRYGAAGNSKVNYPTSADDGRYGAPGKRPTSDSDEQGATRVDPTFAKEGQIWATLDTALNFRGRTRWICLLWAGVTLLFFAFSTNQEYYTFPAYLALFLLLGAAVAGEEIAADQKNGRQGWLLATSALSVAVRLVFAVVLIGGLWSSRHLPFVPDIGAVLAQTNLDTDTLSMGHILNLTGQSFAALRLPAILAVMALVLGSLAEIVLRVMRRNYAGTWALALTMMVFLMAAHVALIRFDPFLSSQVLAERIAQQVRTEDRVLIYGDQAYGSSLVFYLRHPVELVNGRSTSMWFGSTFPDAPQIFLDDNDLVRLWNSGTRVFLFAPDFQQKKVKEVLGDKALVYASSSGKIVYTNRN
jgi:4-amino-4-deoxy-L-arabinose transferase-like glycosyltransferase